MPGSEMIALLREMPELRQNGAVKFEAASDMPWVCVVVAKTIAGHGYHTDGTVPPFVDIVELICSDSEEPGWYESLASRIAEALGWEAVEVTEERRIWPR